VDSTPPSPGTPSHSPEKPMTSHRFRVRRADDLDAGEVDSGPVAPVYVASKPHRSVASRTSTSVTGTPPRLEAY
jgi:hypothetical protein